MYLFKVFRRQALDNININVMTVSLFYSLLPETAINTCSSVSSYSMESVALY